MANNNYPITITNQYQAVPAQVPTPPAILDLDDTISFDVRPTHGCTVFFHPDHVFGRRLKFPNAGTYGPYAPSANSPLPIYVSICATAPGSTCVPPNPHVKAYSIKVG